MRGLTSGDWDRLCYPLLLAWRFATAALQDEVSGNVASAFRVVATGSAAVFLYQAYRFVRPTKHQYSRPLVSSKAVMLMAALAAIGVAEVLAPIVLRGAMQALKGGELQPDALTSASINSQHLFEVLFPGVEKDFIGYVSWVCFIMAGFFEAAAHTFLSFFLKVFTQHEDTNGYLMAIISYLFISNYSSRSVVQLIQDTVTHNRQGSPLVQLTYVVCAFFISSTLSNYHPVINQAKVEQWHQQHEQEKQNELVRKEYKKKAEQPKKPKQQAREQDRKARLTQQLAAIKENFTSLDEKKIAANKIYSINGRLKEIEELCEQYRSYLSEGGEIDFPFEFKLKARRKEVLDLYNQHPSRVKLPPRTLLSLRGNKRSKAEHGLTQFKQVRERLGQAQLSDAAKLITLALFTAHTWRVLISEEQPRLSHAVLGLASLYTAWRLLAVAGSYMFTEKRLKSPKIKMLLVGMVSLLITDDLVAMLAKLSLPNTTKALTANVMPPAILGFASVAVLVANTLTIKEIAHDGYLKHNRVSDYVSLLVNMLSASLLIRLALEWLHNFNHQQEPKGNTFIVGASLLLYATSVLSLSLQKFAYHADPFVVYLARSPYSNYVEMVSYINQPLFSIMDTVEVWAFPREDRFDILDVSKLCNMFFSLKKAREENLRFLQQRYPQLTEAERQETDNFLQRVEAFEFDLFEWARQKTGGVINTKTFEKENITRDREADDIKNLVQRAVALYRKKIDAAVQEFAELIANQASGISEYSDFVDTLNQIQSFYESQNEAIKEAYVQQDIDNPSQKAAEEKLNALGNLVNRKIKMLEGAKDESLPADIEAFLEPTPAPVPKPKPRASRRAARREKTRQAEALKELEKLCRDQNRYLTTYAVKVGKKDRRDPGEVLEDLAECQESFIKDANELGVEDLDANKEYGSQLGRYDGLITTWQRKLEAQAKAAKAAADAEAAAAARIQAVVRGFVAKQHFKPMLAERRKAIIAATRIQTRVRMRMAVKQVKRLRRNKAVTRIQMAVRHSRVEKKVAARKLININTKAARIQSLVRAKTAKQAFKAKRIVAYHQFLMKVAYVFGASNRFFRHPQGSEFLTPVQRQFLCDLLTLKKRVKVDFSSIGEGKLDCASEHVERCQAEMQQLQEERGVDPVSGLPDFLGFLAGYPANLIAAQIGQGYAAVTELVTRIKRAYPAESSKHDWEILKNVNCVRDMDPTAFSRVCHVNFLCLPNEECNANKPIPDVVVHGLNAGK